MLYAVWRAGADADVCVAQEPLAAASGSLFANCTQLCSVSCVAVWLCGCGSLFFSMFILYLMCAKLIAKQKLFSYTV